MDTLIKIIIGVVIGCLATWGFVQFGFEEASNDSKPAVSAKAHSELDSDSSSVDTEQKFVSSETETSKSQAELQNEVALLRQQLRQTEQQLKTVENTKQAAIERLESHITNNTVDNKKSDAKPVSSEENYYQGVPESHHTLVSPPKSRIKTTFDRHKEFVDEKEDIVWSLEKEQQIRSYIQGHSLGAEVTLDLIECKKTMCEVYGSTFSQDSEALSVISDGMRSQPWWDFVGTSTSSMSGDNSRALFLIILHGNFKR
jgi:uncharacterized small protein (DUF1192 family)